MEITVLQYYIQIKKNERVEYVPIPFDWKRYFPSDNNVIIVSKDEKQAAVYSKEEKKFKILTSGENGLKGLLKTAGINSDGLYITTSKGLFLSKDTGNTFKRLQVGDLNPDKDFTFIHSLTDEYIELYCVLNGNPLNFSHYPEVVLK